MNRSGDAVGALVAERGLEAAAVLVVVDDIDLGIGSLRLRPSGGPGTHNGLRDICDAIGTGFARLRLGIRGADPLGDLADYVLAPFPGTEIEDVEIMLDRAVDAVECACREGLTVAMNLYNRRPETSEEPPT
jgi:PTH1 family peptidyl-tRNA hydrolase